MEELKAYKHFTEDSEWSLVNKHAQMVKRIAHHLKGRLPQSVMLDDLIQAGMVGLIEAARKYDASKGAAFETYAGIRIRGHMLDEVRRNDWVPRSVYKSARRVSEAVRFVENTTGRDAKDTEVASQLNLSLDEYHVLLREAAGYQLYGFDDLGVSDDVLSSASEKGGSEPYSDVQRDNLYQHLIAVIDKLPEREQLVLSLYYEQELNLKEIGEVLGVSESRVSQIHSQAMLRVKTRLPDD